MSEPVIGAISAVGTDPAANLMRMAQALEASMAGAAGGAQGTGMVAAPGFEALFKAGLDATNQRLVAADTGVQALATGEASLHDVMIQLEESRLSMQLVVQVRNRLLEAYQDLMRMQV